MLTIRPAQMNVLSQAMLHQFVDRMVVHLRARHPERTKTMTEPDLHRLIRDGLARAKKYRVEAEKDVRRFLECMVSHGRAFDRDPQTSWAGEILRNKKVTGTQKMDQIADYELFVLKGTA